MTKRRSTPKSTSQLRIRPLKADPTRTATQQRLLKRAITGRLRRLKTAITDLLVTQDVFGQLRPTSLPILTVAHLKGQHDQKSHGRSKSGFAAISEKEYIEIAAKHSPGKAVKRHMENSVPLNRFLREGPIEPTGFVSRSALDKHGNIRQGFVSMDEDTIKRNNSLVNEMDSEFGKSTHKADRDMTLFRAIDIDTGKTFKDEGFASLSYSEESARAFGDNVIEVRIKKGTPIIASGSFVEGEFILPRNTLFEKQGKNVFLVKTNRTENDNLTTNIKAASTQLEIIGPRLLTKIFNIQNSLEKEDVVELEDNPHITVRFGLEESVTPEQVEWIAKQYSTIRVRLGKFSLFENEEADVLKAEVHSPDLHRINRHLGILPNKQTYPIYVPHLTVAYLQPGSGKTYLPQLRNDLLGEELVFDSIIFSDKDRNKTTLELNDGSRRLFPRTDRVNERDCKWNDQTGKNTRKETPTGYKAQSPPLERNSLTANGVWEFLTTDEQLTEFKNWLKQQVAITVLAKNQVLGRLDDDHWMREHITRTFQKGMGRAFDVIRYPELQESLDFYQGRRKEFLQSAFNRPVSLERVRLLAGRAFNELEGMTERMTQQLNRTITDGFIRGESPRQIARELSRDVDNLGIERAGTIANTEVVRAFNEGQLHAMEELGVERVGVSIEWDTSGLGTTAKGNPSPCKLCAPLDGIVLKIGEAHGMLPRHPNCRCSWIPSGVGESTTSQKRARSRIKSAIDRSLKAERPKGSKAKPSKWVGSKKRISRNRPKSLVE